MQFSHVLLKNVLIEKCLFLLLLERNDFHGSLIIKKKRLPKAICLPIWALTFLEIG